MANKLDKNGQRRGGTRKGAGRKTNLEKMGVQKRIEKEITMDELFTILAEQARTGNLEAAKYLTDRFLGKPTQSIVQDTTIQDKRIEVSFGIDEVDEDDDDDIKLRKVD